MFRLRNQGELAHQAAYRDVQVGEPGAAAGRSWLRRRRLPQWMVLQPSQRQNRCKR